MNEYEAFKHGDVQSGNWDWAVGKPDNLGRGRHNMVICTINTTAAYMQGIDGEKVAEAFAKTMNEMVKAAGKKP